ncbi:Cytochrome c [Thalassoglobus neptunius]|uniref:Cytochrome c n=1 Tax=Thalassoglobus neptunius TaxID=1938619 RepID=A0A5C5X2M1_9PLAN|nr:PVC-type heme-binding CxxCH protein [Thalassoglobus neptunius]TWT57078.1 Cytochrome c [Thalassoglobus neptunius]
MRHLVAACALLVSLSASSFAQRLEIPRRHEKPPGPALSPEEAVEKMVVPEGFSVQVVAHEPDVVNPVGMCIDEKGRFWITESFEYPRREPGPGRDRIKVLEDTDGDGRVDKTTVFAEGLNIPSGIAVGYGGVWVANAPDLLFMQDTDGDLKADKIETVVTGFGRTDTHELPNSLTWGPDGWLYGLNGVFNYCDVKYTEENPNFDPNHPGWKFTCAMFRVHPRTREFQIFSEGTSNPWGIAINGEGDFFISACVIDHLWHIVEDAYYIRQGGPYPPHTWPHRSIVDHKHQKAAYCGITWFESPAYPAEYQNVLYMGNIHGACINADIADPNGASFKGRPHPGFPAPEGAFEHDTVRKIGEGEDARLADFLSANDAWFMPVVQKVGPDGCLYILDWYDRYHCYQDANADPEGVDRGKGRLYRVVYQGHTNTKAADLGAKSDDELVTLLDDANVYNRETAQRLLSERIAGDSEAYAKLESQSLDTQRETDSRLRSMWTLSGTSAGISEETLEQLVADSDPLIRSWGIRLARNLEPEAPGLGEIVVSEFLNREGEDPYKGDRFEKLDPKVLLQLAVLIPKYEGTDFLVPLKFRQTVELMHVQKAAANDPLITHVVWQNLLEMSNTEGGMTDVLNGFLTVQSQEDRQPPVWMGRLVNVAMSRYALSGEQAAAMITVASRNPRVAHDVIGAVTRGIQQYPPKEEFLTELREAAEPLIRKALISGRENELFEDYLFLGAALGMNEAQVAMRQEFHNSRDEQFRLRVVQTLIAAEDQQVLALVRDSLTSKTASNSFRSGLISSLGDINDPEIAEMLIEIYDDLQPNVQPRVIEVLTQRSSWSLALLEQIEAEQLAKELLNLNQLKRVASFKDPKLKETIARVYGQIREDRRSDRQHVINFHRDFLNGTPGDPHHGFAVFKKVCAQCHKIYGEGADVGPDITRNGRNNWNQLLQNVFDPSAVIGPGYQARLLATEDGRVLTGLPIEESDTRVVLKIQGGKIESIPREEIEAYKVSEVSMMPEDLEKQLTPQELADLFAFLALDKPPTDPEAKILSGAPKQKIRDQKSEGSE